MTKNLKVRNMYVYEGSYTEHEPATQYLACSLMHSVSIRLQAPSTEKITFAVGHYLPDKSTLEVKVSNHRRVPFSFTLKSFKSFCIARSMRICLF